MSSPDLQNSIKTLLFTCKNFGNEEITRKLLTNLFQQHSEDPTYAMQALLQELAVYILHPPSIEATVPTPSASSGATSTSPSRGAYPPQPFHSQSFFGSVPVPYDVDEASTPLSSAQASLDNEENPIIDDNNSPLSDKIYLAVNAALALAETEIKEKDDIDSYANEEEEYTVSGELISKISKNVTTQLNLKGEDAQEVQDDIEEALNPFYGQPLSENKDNLICAVHSLLSDTSYHLKIGGDRYDRYNINEYEPSADHLNSLIYNTATEEREDGSGISSASSAVSGSCEKKKSLHLKTPTTASASSSHHRSYLSPTAASSSTFHITPTKNISPSPSSLKNASRTPPPRGITATPNSARLTRINYNAIDPQTPAWFIPKSPLDALFRKGYGGIGQNDLKTVMKYVDDDDQMEEELEETRGEERLKDRSHAYYYNGQEEAEEAEEVEEEEEKPDLGENLYGGSAKYEGDEEPNSNGSLNNSLNNSNLIQLYQKDVINFDELGAENEDEDDEEDDDDDEEDDEEEGEEFEFNSLEAQGCNTTVGMTINSATTSSTGFPQSDEEPEIYSRNSTINSSPSSSLKEKKFSPKKSLKEQLLNEDSEYLQPDDLPYTANDEDERIRSRYGEMNEFFTNLYPPHSTTATTSESLPIDPHHIISDELLLKNIKESYQDVLKEYGNVPSQGLSASEIYGYDYDEHTVGTSVDSEKYKAIIKKSPSKSPVRIRQIKKSSGNEKNSLKSEKNSLKNEKTSFKQDKKEEIKRPSSAKPTQICREGLGGVSLNDSETALATANILNMTSKHHKSASTNTLPLSASISTTGAVIAASASQPNIHGKKKKISKLSSNSRLLEGTSASRIRIECREKQSLLNAEEKKQQLIDEKKYKKNSFGNGH